MFTPIQNDRKTQGVIARLWVQSYHGKLSDDGEYWFLLTRKSVSFFIINKYDPTIISDIVSNADINHGNHLLNMWRNVTWSPSKISFSANCNVRPKVFH